MPAIRFLRESRLETIVEELLKEARVEGGETTWTVTPRNEAMFEIVECNIRISEVEDIDTLGILRYQRVTGMGIYLYASHCQSKRTQQPRGFLRCT